MARYFVGFLLAVGLIVVVVILIIRGLTAPHKGGPTALDLPSYAETDTRVQLTIDTPVTDPDRHNDVILTVGNTASTLVVTKGYDGNTVRIKTYPMTTSAYDVFLRSLNYNGFTKGNNDPSIKDERGHCATGDRIIYEVIDGSGNDLQRYWHTTCNQGTFSGNVDIVQRLFIAQFPDYNSLTNDVRS